MPITVTKTMLSDASRNGRDRAKSMVARTRNPWITEPEVRTFCSAYTNCYGGGYQQRAATTTYGTRVRNPTPEESRSYIIAAVTATWGGPPPQPLQLTDRTFYVHPRVQNQNWEDGKDKTRTAPVDLQGNQIDSPRNTVNTPGASPQAAPRSRSGSHHSSPMSETEKTFNEFINMPSNSPSPGPSGTQPARGNLKTHNTLQSASAGPSEKRGNSAVRTPTHSPSGLPVLKKPKATSSTSNTGVTRDRAISVSSSPPDFNILRRIPDPRSLGPIPSPPSFDKNKEQDYIGKGKGRKF